MIEALCGLNGRFIALVAFMAAFGIMLSISENRTRLTRPLMRFFAVLICLAGFISALLQDLGRTHVPNGLYGYGLLMSLFAVGGLFAMFAGWQDPRHYPRGIQ